jgi:hypothetical protein
MSRYTNRRNGKLAIFQKDVLCVAKQIINAEIMEYMVWIVELAADKFF